MEFSIKEAERYQLIKKVIDSKYFLGDYATYEGGIISFLEMIWDLRLMPSQDSRFTNARDDILKHIVMNDDLTIEELFLDRLPDSYKNVDIFIKIINSSAHPSVIANIENRSKYIIFLDELFHPFGYKMLAQDYFEGELVYTLSRQTLAHNALPKDITTNSIPFYRDIYKGQIQYPCFRLDSSEWNDWFTWKTLYILSYLETEENKTYIGNIKIMKVGEDITDNSLPETFKYLPEGFYSLGESENFYQLMKSVRPNDFYSVFLALHDTALFPKTYDAIKDNVCFQRSLLREKSYRYALDMSRYALNGINVDNYYKFSYAYLAPYMKDEPNNYINLDFDFIYNSHFEQRLYAIIGQNGVGKTRLLTSLAEEFSKAHPNNIFPRKPVYNKVMSVSFSAFDTMPLPQPNAQFNYVYLGLRNNENKPPLEYLMDRLQHNLQIINEQHQHHTWKVLVNNTVMSLRLISGDSNNDREPIEIDKLLPQIELLSSGEKIIIYTISCILAEIKDNSLLLFDEPETHLHPNAISNLITALYEILSKFNSFCIVATHSPMIIQEVSSKCVFILRRIDDCLEINKPNYETFAESITTITDDIFGNRQVGRYYKKALDLLSEETENYEDILKILKTQDIPLPLYTRLYLKDKLNEKSKKV